MVGRLISGVEKVSIGFPLPFYYFVFFQYSKSKSSVSIMSNMTYIKHIKKHTIIYI
jgi:hypothetical protein